MIRAAKLLSSHKPKGIEKYPSITMATRDDSITNGLDSHDSSPGTSSPVATEYISDAQVKTILLKLAAESKLRHQDLIARLEQLKKKV